MVTIKAREWVSCVSFVFEHSCFMKGKILKSAISYFLYPLVLLYLFQECNKRKTRSLYNTPCHSCWFACHQSVLKTFPCPDVLYFMDGVVLLCIFFGKFAYIYIYIPTYMKIKKPKSKMFVLEWIVNEKKHFQFSHFLFFFLFFSFLFLFLFFLFFLFFFILIFRLFYITRCFRVNIK